MKTIEITLYKFEELSKEGQDKAIERYSNFNVEFDWWDFIYEDANNIGITVKGFDIDRGSYCEIEMNNDPIHIAQDILKQHGEICNTYKLATKFIEDFKTVEEDDLDYLEEDFKKDLSEEFLNDLRKEYEYRTSEEAIKEALIANEYDFTENGKIY